MKKLLLPLLLVFPFLSGCQKSNAVNLDNFYRDIKSGNFTVDDHQELKQVFYSDKCFETDITGKRVAGILKADTIEEKKGIYEFYQKDDGSYGIHGMLTEVYNLSIFDFSNNFYRVSYCNKTVYEKKGDSYILDCSIVFPYQYRDAQQYWTESGFVSSYDMTYMEKIIISKAKGGYTVKFSFRESRKGDNYSISITNIGKNKNEALENFVENPTIVKQTDWNEYQREAIDFYGFKDTPFYSGYTTGFRLYFGVISQTEAAAMVVYDYFGTAEDENGFKSELLEKDYYEQSYVGGIYTYAKNLDDGTASIISFEFVAPSELDAYDLIAFPRGYFQVVYSSGIQTVNVTLEQANTYITNAQLPTIADNDKITRITYSNDNLLYADIENDPGVIAACAEAGIEPGPFYDYLFTLTFYIENKNDAFALVDQYRNSLLQMDNRHFAEEYNTTNIPASQLSAYSVELCENDVENIPDVAIDIYYFNMFGELNEYGGFVQIMFGKFTDVYKTIYYKDNN